MNHIDKVIEKKQAELAALIFNRDGLAALEPAQQVAEHLHTFCSLAHKDQCDWDYGAWHDAKQPACRHYYLAHGEKVLAHFGSVEASIAAIDVVRKSR